MLIGVPEDTFALTPNLLEGHASVYELIGGSWVQLGDLIAGESRSDKAGSAGAMSGDGNRVVIGSPGNDGANGWLSSDDFGQARVFELVSASWTRIDPVFFGLGAVIIVDDDDTSRPRERPGRGHGDPPSVGPVRACARVSVAVRRRLATADAPHCTRLLSHPLTTLRSSEARPGPSLLVSG